MKTLLSSLLISVVILLISNVHGLSVGSHTNTGDVMSNRSDADLEAALSQADAIFVGKVLNLGFPITKAPGQATYHGVNVEVLRILKGSVPHQVRVRLVSRHIQGKVEEPTPEVGHSYIIFAKTSRHVAELSVVKLLPGDDASIATVQRALQH